MKNRLETLARDWHEAGRQNFETNYRGLNYDTYSPKLVTEKKKYFYLDENTCGVFMVEKSTGNFYRIKAYGQINRKKFCGNIETVTGIDLNKLRWR